MLLFCGETYGVVSWWAFLVLEKEHGLSSMRQKRKRQDRRQEEKGQDNTITETPRVFIINGANVFFPGKLFYAVLYYTALLYRLTVQRRLL